MLNVLSSTLTTVLFHRDGWDLSGVPPPDNLLPPVSRESCYAEGILWRKCPTCMRYKDASEDIGEAGEREKEGIHRVCWLSGL